MSDHATSCGAAGMITLYNSQRTVIDNVKLIVEQVDCLYVVDNSEVTDDKLVTEIRNTSDKVKYISNRGNLGIARALNVAADNALEDGFAYLLLLDDDSRPHEGLVSQLLSIYRSSSASNIGIVAAQSDESVQSTDSVEDVLTIITSGSLLNLTAYKVAGPFLEDLFIDWVDLEYCFRLREHKYRVLVHNAVRLNHRLGIFHEKRILGHFPIRWRSHSPLRLYYKFRNSQYVMRQYRPQLPLTFMASIYYELGLDVLKILFLESNKAKYLTSIRAALIDGFKGRLGAVRG